MKETSLQAEQADLLLSAFGTSAVNARVDDKRLNSGALGTKNQNKVYRCQAKHREIGPPSLFSEDLEYDIFEAKKPEQKFFKVSDENSKSSDQESDHSEDSQDDHKFDQQAEDQFVVKGRDNLSNSISPTKRRKTCAMSTGRHVPTRKVEEEFPEMFRDQFPKAPWEKKEKTFKQQVQEVSKVHYSLSDESEKENEGDSEEGKPEESDNNYQQWSNNEEEVQASSSHSESDHEADQENLLDQTGQESQYVEAIEIRQLRQQVEDLNQLCMKREGTIGQLHNDLKDEQETLQAAEAEKAKREGSLS